MKDISVRDIVNETSGKLLQGPEDLLLTSVTTDSRMVGENALFVGISGETMDGNRFAASAVENGAKAAMISDARVYEAYRKDHPEDRDTAFILVDNTTDAIQRTARMARRRIPVPAVGVTGSVGKTTTREMIACALSAEKKVYRTSRNYNNWLGVPLTLCDLSDAYDIAVLELGLNVRGELGLISSLTDIDTAVITNIGMAHLEFYGTRDELCREKFTITRGFNLSDPRPKLLILNGDDPYLRKYKDLTGFPYVFYGSTEDCAYRFENIRVEDGRFVFDFCFHENERLEVKLSVLGRHNVMNACAALAAADDYGVDLKKAAEALEGYRGFRSRLERHEKDGWLLIDDTYNASPDSMKAGLQVLHDIEYREGGRKIAVLGDMLELGDDSARYHYEVGAYAAPLGIDLYLMRGTDILNAKRAILEKSPDTEIRVFDDLDTLITDLKAILKPGDVLYVKASHYTGIHRVTEELTGSGGADKERLIIVAGPTAAGKSAAAVELALRIGGEIISADSMQVYRGMDIGSAKIRADEMRGVPHYLLDVLEPEEEFNVTVFQELARKAMDQIRSNGHIPIITGGTGFYIRSVLYDTAFTENDTDKDYRHELETLGHEKGAAYLHEMLRERDPESAVAIHENNMKRVIRALEYLHDTGEPISEHNARERKKQSPYDFRYFVMTMDRAHLYERIDRRVDLMMEEGLLQEVISLRDKGLARDAVSMQGLGYKQLLKYLDGEMTLPEAVAAIKQETRHFAKRQLTWFRREPDVIWVDAEKEKLTDVYDAWHFT